MNSVPFINIHSHNSVNGQAVSISNVFVHKRQDISPKGMYSLGLHPWHLLEATLDFDVTSTLQYYIDNDSSFIAIGEIGIDHAIAIPIEFQTKLFEAQLLVAQKNDLPVIIHCVRAFSELIHLKKKLALTVPLIIHGYCAKPSITQELLKHGFCFSFGSALLSGNKNAIDALITIPSNRIFFETDDQKCTIEDIYTIASEIKGIDIEELKTIVFENVRCCFNRFNC